MAPNITPARTNSKLELLSNARVRRAQLASCLIGAAVMLWTPIRAEAAPALKVTIEMNKQTVGENNVFPITAKIQNMQANSVTLHVWSCSYQENWITDNPSVKTVSVSCKKNDLQYISLQPSLIYTRSVSVQISELALKQPATSYRFRLGFNDGPTTTAKNDLTETAWSNPITIKVALDEKELKFKPATEKGQILKPGEKAPKTTLEKSNKEAENPAVTLSTATH